MQVVIMIMVMSVHMSIGDMSMRHADCMMRRTIAVHPHAKDGDSKWCSARKAAEIERIALIGPTNEGRVCMTWRRCR